MRVVLIEDHPMMRELVRHVCEHDCGDEVVAEAETGAAGLAAVRALGPELAILDLMLPDMDGIAVAEEIARTLRRTRVLVLTSRLDPLTVWRIERAGVHGFLDKGSNTTDTLRVALRALAAGRTYFSAAFLAARLAQRTDTRSFEKVLSDAEQQVLVLVGEGLDDAEIATRLGIAPTTAQTHRSHILRKLQIKGSAKLVAWAAANGFTRLASPTGWPRPRTGMSPA